MDYFQQQTRPQGGAPPQNHNQHYVYTAQTAGGGSHTAPAPAMYYQQQQPMGHQQQQPPAYQQYAPPQQQTAGNTSMDYGSQQHNQSGMSGHSQGGSGRGVGGRGPRSGNGQHPAEVVGHPQGQRYVPAAPVQELPLRIVIDSKHVGAIIGQGGANIREITKESKARVVVDTHRTMKDMQGHSEKIISIIGPVENCSKACVKIMEVVQRELEKDENRESNEVELKIRAHNQLVGRLIGKQGATIKKIMQETGTTIFVSNEAASRTPELSAMMPPFPDVMMQMERTITVKGPSIENIISAEQKISAKLRQSYETDVQNRMAMGSMQGGIPGLVAPMGTDAYSLMGAMRPMQPMMGGNQAIKETKMWVPNSMVGAIIGAKGTNIRNIMRHSGANIRIEGGERKEQRTAGEGEESREEEETQETGQGDGHGRVHEQQQDGAQEKKEDERLVTISGTEMQQYKAQYFIFQRVSEQSQHFIDEVKLRTELTVPARLVGRIIGKGGQNVRELQRITGATVKIPEDESKSSEGEASQEPKEESSEQPAPSASSSEGTVVRIVGNFSATQQVQCRVGQLICEFNRTSLQDKRREEANDSSRKQSPPSNGGGGSAE